MRNSMTHHRSLMPERKRVGKENESVAFVFGSSHEGIELEEKKKRRKKK